MGFVNFVAIKIWADNYVQNKIVICDEWIPVTAGMDLTDLSLIKLFFYNQF